MRQVSEEMWWIDETGLEVPALFASTLRTSLYPGIREAYAAYDVLAIVGNPQSGWMKWIEEALDHYSLDTQSGRRHRIPVCYSMGADLIAVSQALSIPEDAVIAYHISRKYRCYAVGFQPGFGYLGYLPDAISGIPRRPSPRTSVEPGSVGIALDQTAVYPSASPGGWSLIGKTPCTLVDVAADYFALEAGDEVEFVPITAHEYGQMEGKRLCDVSI